MRSWFGRFLRSSMLAAVLVTGGKLWAGDGVHCDTCGAYFGARLWIRQDQVTCEERQICEKCSRTEATCFLCKMPVKAGTAGVLELADGRHLCARDAQDAVLHEAESLRLCDEVGEQLDRVFSRFLAMPKTNVALAVLDRSKIESLLGMSPDSTGHPNVLGVTTTIERDGRFLHTISLLSAQPATWVRTTSAHEYGHAWIHDNVPAWRKGRLARNANEGFCELIAYIFADAQMDAAGKKRILANNYTRGQIALFVDAYEKYGFNDVLDWMKCGLDDRLDAADPNRLRNVKPPGQSVAAAPPAKPVPARAPARAAAAAVVAAPPAGPSTLAVKAIFWSPSRPSAIINQRTFEPQQEGPVPLGPTNVTVRCLGIRPDAVRVRILSSGEERELKLARAGG